MAKKPEELKAKKRAAIYCRVSTYEQGRGDFSSLDSQEKINREYCEKNGWTVVDVYSDTRTGATLDRTQLERLLRDASAHGFDLIAVTKLDRISRSVKDFLELDQRLMKLGIEWAITTQQIDTTTSAGKMQRTIMLAFAEFERDLIAERTREKLFAQARNGYWGGGYAPLGYDVINKRLIVNGEEKKLVQLIFKLYTEHSSLVKVTDEINKRGYRTKLRYWKRTHKNSGGSPFSKTVIGDVLRNPLYLGLVRFKSETFKGLHEPIIDERLFNQVQKQLAASATGLAGTHRDTPLELLGTVKCGFCTDKSFTSYYTNKENKRYFYYKCTTKTKISEKSCPSWTLPADELEKFVRRLAMDLANNPEFFNSAMKLVALNSAEDQTTLQTEQTNKKKLLEKLNRDETKIIDTIKLSDSPEANSRLKEELQQISADKKGIKGELDRIEKELANRSLSQFDPQILHSVLKDYNTIIDALSVEQRQIANQCLFQSITSTIKKETKQGMLDFYIRGDKHLKTVWDSVKASGWKNWSQWLLGQDSNLQPIG